MKWSTKKSAHLHTIMAAILIRTGHTPERWYQCTDFMLPKKQDEWCPSKLRLVVLLTLDYNHNNNILGQAVIVRWAEKKKMLAPEQYKSQKIVHCKARVEREAGLRYIENTKATGRHMCK